MERVRRRLIEHLRYGAVYRCHRCHVRVGISRWWTLLLAFHRCCPKCGGTRLECLKHRDRIDPLYKNPLSLVQGLLGAKLWWCPRCRIQFYDTRPAAPAEVRR